MRQDIQCVVIDVNVPYGRSTDRRTINSVFLQYTQTETKRIKMYFVLRTLITIILVTISFGDPLSKSFIESSHPHYRTVGNPNIPLEYDCQLRAFTIEMASYIAPASVKANWTALSQSALQMNQCNHTSSTTYQPRSSAKHFRTAPNMKKGDCHHTVFVHDFKGNDLFDGSFEKPVKTIQAALSLTRTLRAVYGNDKTLCMTIRGGTYYLGTNATTSSSQIGAIALTSNDSNLVIENYQDERVTLSGGVLLHLQWSIHVKTPNGTIMRAQLPSSVDLDQFNELYIDGRRAIVAKYPNGDPSTQGLYATNPGFSFNAHSWFPPVHTPSVDILVQSPIRNGTKFPNYQVGVGGGASVFNPPRSFWNTDSPPGGDNYAVPRGFTLNNGALPHMKNWSNPKMGFVHTFHGAYWGGWIFQIASSNSTENTIMFERGGFQEARGWKSGGPFYVSNIFEELDSPNEWFLDKDARTLYFMPNGTMPNTFVASQIPCLISVSGSGIENSVYNVLIQGLTLTETSHTYMGEYVVPSGGDWSVHLGGTIYLTNTRNITITHNLFTQLGSNGIAVTNYNDATLITSNEFGWLADSGIVLVGSTNGIDGFSVTSQPSNTLIQSNLFHEIGIYIKQSSCVLIAVSRSVSIIGNLMFNMPRAAINVNDGFYGNHTLSWNVIFNTVRETGDHGPINSWDRQPFLTDAVQTGVPSLWQHKSYIHHNTLIGNYRSVWPIDHDDGSCFYEDSYNFLVYGGKKDLFGHSKIDHHQIYVYADVNEGAAGRNACIVVRAAKKGISGWNEVWVNNTCVLYASPVPYAFEFCETTDLFLPFLMSNRIYIPSGTAVAFTCKVNGTDERLTLEQWQSYGLDLGTTVNTAPDIKVVIEWGREMLQYAE